MFNSWKKTELLFLIIYALTFYFVIISRSAQLSHKYGGKLYSLRLGWIPNRFNDVSDAQWRNFRANLPILTGVMGIFTLIANTLRFGYCLRWKGMSIIWLLISLCYLSYLHGACVAFVLSIASINFILVKVFARSIHFSYVLWVFNMFILLWNRIYEGYSFSSFGQSLAFLDNYRGTFRWHICFNLVILRMISFGYDYHWAHTESRFDKEKHTRGCHICSSGKTCYRLLQEKGVHIESYSFITYLCYLIYAPLYIAGPIIGFNGFVSQLDMPQNNYSAQQVIWYGTRWIFSLLLMEIMSHFFYYNAFAISGLWREFSPLEIFIIGYGVLNFMWLKFFLIWRYFRFWSLVGGIEAPENMPKCVNNCYNLESFWKSWHASFNKWIVRYMYIPLGGARRKLLNVWIIFTFVAIWHDLEWKLLSWAWLTCFFFIPEIIVKSAVTTVQTKDKFGEFILRELSALAGAITITCLMVANLVGYVIGPSGISWFISRLLQRDGIDTITNVSHIQYCLGVFPVRINLTSHSFRVTNSWRHVHVILCWHKANVPYSGDEAKSQAVLNTLLVILWMVRACLFSSNTSSTSKQHSEIICSVNG